MVYRLHGATGCQGQPFGVAEYDACAPAHAHACTSASTIDASRTTDRHCRRSEPATCRLPNPPGLARSMRDVSVADEALLAPVPLDLLEDADEHGLRLVAFGSMAWEFFQHLTTDHPAEPLDVLIYASHAGEFTLEVAWAGTFLGWRDAIEAESDPTFEGELRSPLALSDWAGNEEGGRWAVYWIVDNLHRLERPIPFAELHLPGGKGLSAAFIPHGPTRIQAVDNVR